MTAPDLDEVTLVFEDLGVEIDRWTSYTFSTSWLTPADGFRFTIGDPDIPNGVSGRIVRGLRVSLDVAGQTVCTGYLDSVTRRSDRGGGTVLDVAGRDVLGVVVDAGVDPALRWPDGTRFTSVLADVLGRFGFRSVVAPPTAALTATKPHPGEGVYEFCERLAKRQGLHIVATRDGRHLAATRPNFDQPAAFTLTRLRGIGRGAANNILEGEVALDLTNQPSVIVATGSGGGGEHPRSRLRAVMVNDVLERTPEVDRLVASYVAEGALLVPTSGRLSPVMTSRRARTIHLHDDESRDLDQLAHFVRREMATRQREALRATYTVAGHTQAGQPWLDDRIAMVHDEVGDIARPMWIESVTLTKSRGAGTTTTLGLILPHTMEL